MPFGNLRLDGLIVPSPELMKSSVTWARAISAMKPLSWEKSSMTRTTTFVSVSTC